MIVHDNAAASVGLSGKGDRPLTYDYVVCGAGTGGSVVAARLAADSAAKVLLIEAGGDDAGEQIDVPQAWLSNIGSLRDWGVTALPSEHLNGRTPLLSMGRVLGGGSSINAMIWARGHRSDWDGYSRAVGDEGWSYDSVLRIFRRIEDWHGAEDRRRRGTGGAIFLQPTPDPAPLTRAVLAAAASSGLPVADANGVMMEQPGGAALTNLRIRDGRRQSIYRSYVAPLLGRENLTVMTGALVTRVLMEEGRATGVLVDVDGETVRISADAEVVLALGAFHTPKLLMQSGIGDRQELGRHGIDVLRHVPGVGRNLQDHVLLRGCTWASPEPVPFTNNGCEASLFWRSDGGAEQPDIHSLLVAAAAVTPEVQAASGEPLATGWSLFPALLRPASRGRVALSGPRACDPVVVDWGALSEPRDMAALVAAVELSRSVGNAEPLSSFRLRESLPGRLDGEALENFIRNAATSYWHQSCTARMGTDDMAVVDARLRVRDVKRLRIADASVFPWVPTGNTMAPTVIVAERAAEMLQADA
ncbi:choline dehydrogenase [Sphingomonas sp. BK069]|nr:choline dehydrogenase [Sphingomonas sp. BK069]